LPHCGLCVIVPREIIAKQWFALKKKKGEKEKEKE
jgi:hypothetical protein